MANKQRLEQKPAEYAGGGKPMEGVPPGVDPAEWEAFLQSRKKDMGMGPQGGYAQAGGGFQNDLIHLMPPAMDMSNGTMWEMPIVRGGPRSRLDMEQATMLPMPSAQGGPWPGYGMGVAQIGMTNPWGDSKPGNEPPQRMPPGVPPGAGGGFARPHRLSPKEMEAAVASDRERYLASIGRGPATPGPQISPAIQSEPAVQVKPGIRREPPQKDPASYDVKPGKEPPQRMPPQVEPPVSTRERKKKSRIKPTGVRQNA